MEATGNESWVEKLYGVSITWLWCTDGITAVEMYRYLFITLDLLR